MTKRIPLVTTETTEMLFENKKSYEKKESPITECYYCVILLIIGDFFRHSFSQVIQ